MNNHSNRLIVITGLPGTGKTTLSRRIAKELALPLIAKDAIKEIMFDKLGWSDRAWSNKLAQATFGIMDHIVEQHLVAGQPLVLESNFSPKLASERFRNWQKDYGCNIAQVVCQANIDVLVERFIARNRHDRHPGHVDDTTADQLREGYGQRLAAGEDQPLDVEGPVIFIDTTDFNNVNFGHIIEQLQL